MEIRTVANNHYELVGKTLIIDGWETEICDTTVSDDGTIYVAVRVKALTALYLQQRWHKYLAKRGRRTRQE